MQCKYIFSVYIYIYVYTYVVLSHHDVLYCVPSGVVRSPAHYQMFGVQNHLEVSQPGGEAAGIRGSQVLMH